jgi:hypothetical protein
VPAYHLHVIPFLLQHQYHDSHSFLNANICACPCSWPGQTIGRSHFAQEVLEAKIALMGTNGMACLDDSFTSLTHGALVVHKTEKISCQRVVVPSLGDPCLQPLVTRLAWEVCHERVPLEGVKFVVAISPDYLFCKEVHLYGVIRGGLEFHQAALPTHPLLWRLFWGELEGA